MFCKEKDIIHPGRHRDRSVSCFLRRTILGLSPTILEGNPSELCRSFWVELVPEPSTSNDWTMSPSKFDLCKTSVDCCCWGDCCCSCCCCCCSCDCCCCCCSCDCCCCCCTWRVPPLFRFRFLPFFFPFFALARWE